MHVGFRLNTQGPKRQSGRARTSSLVGRTVLLVALSVVVWAPPALATTTSATPSGTEPYRACPMPTPGYYECEEIVEPAAYVQAKSALGEILPAEEGTGELGGWSPENLKSAYKLPATGGKGETVAIVDAFNYPDAEADLKVFREHYKLVYKGTETACTRANECFKKINQKGESAESETATLYPTANRSWSKEMSLDLDMVSAVCPECKLLLVESNTNSTEDLDTAEAEAATESPVAISNSWGNAGEYFEETENDTYFDHPGIPIVFAAGDTGYGPKYPATSPYVISAGGTQLTKAPLTSRKWSEEVWHNEPAPGDSTGSGCSEYEPKPAWQTDKGCAKRTDNDISAVAYKLSAYDSYEQTGEERWTTRSGTSASTPIIAGVEALAPTATRAAGAEAFYRKPSMVFDITNGTDGTCTTEYLCTAVAGFDGPTGWGTPDRAFSLTSPSAITGSATAITKTGATIGGTVNPSGIASKYYFEYGTTASYGTKTAEASAGSGTSNVEVSKGLTGLVAGKQYDFRVVATNSAGETNEGANHTFVTLPNAPENSSLPVPAPAVPDQAVPESTTNGTWTNSPTSYEYQWERCNATGGECTSIEGATKATYTPLEADVEHTLVAKVTATNAGGSSSAHSAATAKVAPIGRLTEFGPLAEHSFPSDITAGPDGNLWFMEEGTSKVVKMTPSGTMTEYALPKGSGGWGITPGPAKENALWFVEDQSDEIGKITTSGTITEYAGPEGMPIMEIVAGPDGNLWFTGSVNAGASEIGKITTAGTLTQYALPSKSAPEGIAAGPDGNLWFTENGKIGKITTSGVITEYPLPSYRYVSGITAGPDGNLWFTAEGTEAGSTKIGRITTSGAITEYALPDKSHPINIATGADGNLWFTEYSTGKIGRITTSGTVTEYAGLHQPYGIASGPDDNVWFTEGTEIGKITP